MTSSIDGTAAGTTQAQICQQRRFFAGTYAPRCPTAGPDGDQLAETFYEISPPQGGRSTRGTASWTGEYLPNGGWGTSAPTLFVTSWATLQLDPWIADDTYNMTSGSLVGWHTLVMQVSGGTVSYYLDGVLVGNHGGKYYPDVPMSINDNLWFIAGGQLSGGGRRRYREDADWVYYQAGAVLSPQSVAAAVAKLRRARVAFRDRVPSENPPLNSPCNLSMTGSRPGHVGCFLQMALAAGAWPRTRCYSSEFSVSSSISSIRRTPPANPIRRADTLLMHAEPLRG